MKKRQADTQFFPFLVFLLGFSFLAFITNESISIVFLALLPTLIHLIMLYIFPDDLPQRAVIAWAGPIIYSFIFLFVARTSANPDLYNMQHGTVLVLNILLSFFLNFFYIPSRAIDPSKAIDDQQEKIDAMQEKLEKYEEALLITRQNLTSNLLSIEDKCKALNFVIGRVYADKKGGSKEIREMINVPREWYNTFSEITADPQEEDLYKLKEIMQKLYDRLQVIEKREQSLFSPKITHLPIERDAQDSVLDVLSKNDKDPVVDYHKGAKETCERFLDFFAKEIETTN